MKESIIINLFILYFYPAICQNEYREISICSSTNRQIKAVKLGGYSLNYEKGNLVSISSSNNDFEYFEMEKTIKISLNQDTAFSLRLTEFGVVFSSADTSIKIRSLGSLGIYPSDSSGIYTSFVRLKKNFIVCTFKQNKLEKVHVNLRDFKLSILFHLEIDKPTWDFGITNYKEQPLLTVTYGFEFPYLVVLDDPNKLLRVSTSFSKVNGQIKRLEGLRIDRNGLLVGNNSVVQYYKKNGIVKRDSREFGVVKCND